jgi:hypothetical protein
MVQNTRSPTSDGVARRSWPARPPGEAYIGGRTKRFLALSNAKRGRRETVPRFLKPFTGPEHSAQGQ